jgi:hypothetical protein
MQRTAQFVMLLAALMTTHCGGESTNSAAVQRSVTEYTLPDGTELVALSGAIRASDGQVISRFVAPQGRLEVTTSADATGEKSVVLDNLSPAGSVSLSIVQVVTEDEVDGCGTASATILCATATAAVGNSCPAEGCPTGTICDDSNVCAATNALTRCDAQVVAGDFPTRQRLTFSPEPCTRSIFEVAPPDVDTVDFAVAGAGDYITVLDDLRGEVDRGEVDFVVLLGDNLSGADAQLVQQMSDFALNYPVPIVALPGEVESRITDSPRFVGRFGPGDFFFRYGPLRAFSFTSAGRHLGTRGLDRIRSLIRQARRSDEPTADFPVFSFTHVPPVDPNGARDLGFQNEIEGARTMSLLTADGVDVLIAGHVLNADSASYGDLELLVTSAEKGFLGEELETLRVTVGPADEVGGTVLGEWSYDVRRVPR